MSAEFQSVRPRHPNQSAFTVAEIMLAVGVLALVVAIITPNFVQSRTNAQTKSCIANLQTIDSAKQQWAAENKKPLTAAPKKTDLFGAGLYVQAMPVCPAGGTHGLHAVSKKPTCSIAGHTL